MPRLPDVTIVYPNGLVFVEAIATRLHFAATAVRADVARLRQDLDQMVFEPAEQLSGVIGEFRAGVISLPAVNREQTRVYPLVIVPQTLPQFPAMWEELLPEMERRGILTTTDRDRLQVWDLQELESVLFLMESEALEVGDLADFIEEKIENVRSKQMPLRNYLVVKELQFGAPTFLRDARRKLAGHLAELLEGRKRRD